MKALLLLPLLAGCAGGLPMPRTAGDAQVELNDLTATMRDLDATAGVACTAYGQLPALRLPCQLYLEHWADAAAAVATAQESVRLWAMGEAVASSAAQDVRDAALVLRGAEAIAGELLELVP